MKLNILYEDDAIIACVKPAGVPAQSDKTNDEDMITLIKNYIFEKGESKGEPYVAAVHRLDRPVGGVMVFAKTPEAAAGLSAQITNGTVTKFYQAIVTGEMPDEAGELTDYIVKDAKTNTSKLVSKEEKGAKPAKLSYEVLDVMETDEGILSYILVELHTGRHHQIRVQLAKAGCGIWGDTKYNPKFLKKKSKGRDIALYSSRMELDHPVTGERMIFKSEPCGGAFGIIDLDEF